MSKWRSLRLSTLSRRRSPTPVCGVLVGYKYATGAHLSRSSHTYPVLQVEHVVVEPVAQVVQWEAVQAVCARVSVRVYLCICVQG